VADHQSKNQGATEYRIFDSSRLVGKLVLPVVSGSPVQAIMTDNVHQIEMQKSPWPDRRTILYIEDNLANFSLMEMIVGRMDGKILVSVPNAEPGLS
jgi:hypothetical protein